MIAPKSMRNAIHLWHLLLKFFALGYFYRLCRDMKKHILRYALALFLVGCGGPSEKQMLQQYVDYTQFNHDMPALYEASKHKKLDGYEQSETLYIADMSHEIRFLMDFDQFSHYINESAGFFAPVYLMQIRTEFGDFKQGDVKKMTNTVTFVKKESGWTLFQPN